MQIVAFTTYGSVRGGCGHRHKTYDQARRCLRDDNEGCKTQGGYSDRAIAYVDADGYLYDDATDPESWIPGEGGRSCGAARM